MKFELKEYHVNIPDSDLIADVVAVSKITGRNTVTQADYSKYGKYHLDDQPLNDCSEEAANTH